MYVILTYNHSTSCSAGYPNQRPSRKPDAVSPSIITRFASLNGREECFSL